VADLAGGVDRHGGGKLLHVEVKARAAGGDELLF